MSGALHWYFIVGSSAVLGFAWYGYLRERRRCETERCEMAGGKAARLTLPIATVAVLGFLGLNVYSYAGGSTLDDTSQNSPLTNVSAEKVAIPVEGMTCFTCTIAVERSLSRLNGVGEATASVPERQVTVTYDPAKVSLTQMVEAVNGTGYRARMPEKSEEPHAMLDEPNSLLAAAPCCLKDRPSCRPPTPAGS